MAKKFFDWIFQRKKEDRDKIYEEHQHEVDLDNIEKESDDVPNPNLDDIESTQGV